MDLSEAIRVLAIAATVVVTFAALDTVLACHWLLAQAGDASPPIAADHRND